MHAGTLTLQRSSQYPKEVVMCESSKGEVYLDSDAESPLYWPRGCLTISLRCGAILGGCLL
jgi:hypothetical protein